MQALALLALALLAVFRVVGPRLIGGRDLTGARCGKVIGIRGHDEGRALGQLRLPAPGVLCRRADAHDVEDLAVEVDAVGAAGQ